MRHRGTSPGLSACAGPLAPPAFSLFWPGTLVVPRYKRPVREGPDDAACEFLVCGGGRRPPEQRTGEPRPPPLVDGAACKAHLW
mmetsp:Transcript_72903/g.202291  ORF Transcript_72903/g.202291 Transcript_72903/m.202291 type:complete len:84 (+) Transcript_72903:801-1052(+)